MLPWDKLDWTAVGTGMVFAVVVVFQGVKGFLTGRAAGPASPSPPSSAPTPPTMLLDAKEVVALRDQIGLNTVALIHAKASLERNSDVCDRMLRAINGAHDELGELRDELREQRRK